MIFCAPGTSETHGEAMAVTLAWSGNHRILAERLPSGEVQVQAGILRLPGETRPGTRTEARAGTGDARVERFTNAEADVLEAGTVHVAFSAEGFGGLSRRLHDHVRRRIRPLAAPRSAPRSMPRPVTVNTWEAVYFDHDAGRLAALVDAAAAIGAERFVLDDGWFGRRDDDTSSLGDWRPDPRKFPEGLGPLIERVRAADMQFGLWVEPEMVSPDSDLHRAHPQWATALPRERIEELGRADRPGPLGRNQLVLDIGRRDVFDHLLATLDGLLADNRIDFLKWDMNRDVVAFHDGDGRARASQNVHALYRLLETLRERHPHVEIESCASGGGRIDFGILRHVDRYWASDSNDPIERMRIQMGFSHWLPPELMGAHVGPRWSHTSGRGTHPQLRALVASWGHFGMELDLTRLDEAEREVLTEAVSRYKRDRAIWHRGALHRLEHPDPNLMAVMAVAPDRARARAVVVQADRPRAAVPAPLRLPGLEPDRTYRVTAHSIDPITAHATRRFANPLAEGGVILPGAALARAGVQLPVLFAQTGLGLDVETA